MKFIKEKAMKACWFLGGFGVGFTLIALGHATVASHSTQPSAPVSEIRGGKVAAPEFDHELANLHSLESRYSESDAQQQRIRRSARLARNAPLKKNSQKRVKN